MKAVQCTVGGTGNSVNGVSSTGGGRVSRQRKDVENEEVQMYLSKLKELVPFMPKNRRLSKLEVIQYVIDYICELQETLEGPTLKTTTSNSPLRQPLGVLAPNTLVPPTSCSTQEATSSPTLLDKPSPPDTRPVSC
uniref:Putative extra macrochaetae n=1 Tax=Triatoma infestans TaxID=30076 RepID=A0A023F8V0_TRIIF